MASAAGMTRSDGQKLPHPLLAETRSSNPGRPSSPGEGRLTRDCKAKSGRGWPGLPQTRLGRVRPGGRVGRSGSTGVVPILRDGDKTCRVLNFVATGRHWLTAPDRNETPRYPRLIGTKTPVFGAYSQWITDISYFKYGLKTIGNWAPNQPAGWRS